VVYKAVQCLAVSGELHRAERQLVGEPCKCVLWWRCRVQRICACHLPWEGDSNCYGMGAGVCGGQGESAGGVSHCGVPHDRVENAGSAHDAGALVPIKGNLH